MEDCLQREFEFVAMEGLFDAVIQLLGRLSMPWDNGAEYYSIIPAIRHVRTITGWPLRESKDYVDNIIDNDVVLKKRFNR